MVDPRVLHAITLELCTGFLLLAVAAVVVRVASDGILRAARGRTRLGRWAQAASRIADPTATFALVAGVLGTTLAIATGAHTWAVDAELVAASVPGEIQVVAASQGIFLGAVLLRLFVGPRIWRSHAAGASYAGLVFVGGGLLVLENPSGVPLVGQGSLLGDALLPSGADLSFSFILPAWASLLLVAALPVATVGMGLRLHVTHREKARRDAQRLARDVGDLLGHAKSAGLETAANRRLIRQASAAARQRWYSLSVKLMARAKRDLMAALSFEETPEGDWLATGPGPAISAAPAPAPAPPPAALRVAASAPTRRRRPHVSLATAVDLVQQHRGTFAEDPLEAVQEELQGARAALLDLKIAGRDITQAIGILKDANDHVLREEWDEALECIRAFRREIQE